MNQNLKVHVALLLVGLIYGANYSIAKEVTPDFVLPFAIIFLRVFFAGLLFWLIHRLSIKEKILSRNDFGRLIICGIFGVAGNQLMFFKGLSITSPINAALIMTTTPILVLVASSILINEKITWMKVLGIMLGAFGAIWLISGNDFAFNSETISGDVLIFLNAISYGIYLVLVKPLMKKYHPLTVVKWTFLFGFIIVIPFGVGELSFTAWTTIPTKVYWFLGFIIIGTTFIAYLANTWALRFVNPSIVGFYIYLQPILAAFFAIMMRQDTLRPELLVSSALIFVGVFLVSYVKRR